MTLFDGSLHQVMLLALVVAQREYLVGFLDLDADQRPAVFQDDTPRLEAGRDRAARLQDGLDDVDAGKPAADAGQLRADPFTLVPEPMAFDALRLLSVEEEGAAALGVSRPHQGRLGELLLFSG